MRSYAALASLGFLAGCSTGAVIEQPATGSEPQSFIEAATPPGSPYSLEAPGNGFWRNFNDPVLTAIIETATRDNVDVRLALARVAEARAIRRSGWFDFLPAITLGGSQTRSRLSTAENPAPGAGPRTRDIVDAQGALRWEIDVFGGIRNADRARRSDLGAARTEVIAVRLATASELARSYFELRGLQARIAVANRNAQNQGTTLALTRSRLDGGVGTALDESRARAQWLATQAIQPSLDAAAHRALLRIAVLTGTPAGTLPPELMNPAPLPVVPETVAIGTPRTMLRRRPDVAFAEWRVRAAAARVGVSAAALFPRVTLSGRGGFVSDSLGSLGDDGTDSFSVGPQLSWAFLDLWRVRGDLDAARSRSAQALIAYERTVQLALEDANGALVAHDRARRRNALLRNSAHASREAALLARQRFEAGIADFIAVLDAERTQLEAEDLSVLSDIELAQSLVSVFEAIGAGWPETEP